MGREPCAQFLGLFGDGSGGVIEQKLEPREHNAVEESLLPWGLSLVAKQSHSARG